MEPKERVERLAKTEEAALKRVIVYWASVVVDDEYSARWRHATCEAPLDYIYELSCRLKLENCSYEVLQEWQREVQDRWRLRALLDEEEVVEVESMARRIRAEMMLREAVRGSAEF